MANYRVPPEELTFEAATSELEAIVTRIESGEIGLEEALAERRRGDALLKRCRAILDAAEQELEQVSPDSTAAEGSGEVAGS